jgi:hypothetical protein
MQRQHAENVRAQRRKNRLRHKFATTCQNISGRFEDSVSSQFLVNPELGHSSYENLGIQLGSPVIPPSTIHISAFANKFETDEEMNQKFVEFLYSDRVRIRYLMHPDAHFTEEELRSGHYISVSEFNDCCRENDKECFHRVAGLNERSFHRKKLLICCLRNILTHRFLIICTFVSISMTSAST